MGQTHGEVSKALREKCPNTEFFLVSIFPYSDWIQTEYGEILRISLYSVQMRENTDKKKLRNWILFTQWRRYIQNWKALGSNPGFRWPWVKQVSSTLINIRLVKLPLDIGPKLAVGSLTWWSSLPGGFSSRGKLYVLSYHIYVTSKSIKGMRPFLWAKLTHQDTI